LISWDFVVRNPNFLCVHNWLWSHRFQTYDVWNWIFSICVNSTTQWEAHLHYVTNYKEHDLSACFCITASPIIVMYQANERDKEGWSSRRSDCIIAMTSGTTRCHHHCSHGVTCTLKQLYDSKAGGTKCVRGPETYRFERLSIFVHLISSSDRKTSLCRVRRSWNWSLPEKITKIHTLNSCTKQTTYIIGVIHVLIFDK